MGTKKISILLAAAFCALTFALPTTANAVPTTSVITASAPNPPYVTYFLFADNAAHGGWGEGHVYDIAGNYVGTNVDGLLINNGIVIGFMLSGGN
jgi:hypothetical protein